MHCGLPGAERPERKVAHKVEMGRGRKAVFTKRCPWAEALKDRRVSAWLSTRWIVKDLGIMPPGRLDPQLLDALAIIASEHSRIETEELETK